MKKKTNLPILAKEKELLTPDQMMEMRKLLPEWILELEEKGTAVLRWNTEFLILVEELLRKKFNFSEKDLEKLEQNIKETLPHLHKMSLEGLVLLRPADMNAALGVIEENEKMLKKERSGILLPDKIIKKLK